MAKRIVHRGAFAAVLMLVILVLVALLVPPIAADELLDKIGDFPGNNPTKCTMIDQGGAEIELEEQGPENLEISRVITPNADGPGDVVALLKCQATLANDWGRAITFAGHDFGSTVNCHIDVVIDDIPTYSTTTSWSQTISSSGIATLTCQFKRTPPN